jgi:hypothetical protein
MRARRRRRDPRPRRQLARRQVLGLRQRDQQRGPCRLADQRGGGSDVDVTVQERSPPGRL